GQGGALLAFPPTDASGLVVALSRSHDRRDVSVVPVNDPRHPDERGLYPFFFQDRFRNYFVRPVYTDYPPPRDLAMPLFVRRPIAPPPHLRHQPARRALPPRGRGGRGRREAIDESLLTFEALDAWEEMQDAMWHPDDAAEARAPRQRAAPPRPRPQPARGPARPPVRHAPAPGRVARPAPVRTRRQAGYHERRLQFLPFEHADTCRLIETLKAKGIEGLLDFSTTRPPAGVDHTMRDGVWTPTRPSWFQRHYGVGPLVFEKKLPHLDVAFEDDS